MKTGAFNVILDVVAGVTEVDAEKINSFLKDQEVVEARVLFVWFCNRNGMYTSDIAKFLNRKSTSVIDDKLKEFSYYNTTSIMFAGYAKKIAAILPTKVQEYIETEVKKVSTTT